MSHLASLVRTSRMISWFVVSFPFCDCTYIISMYAYIYIYILYIYTHIIYIYILYIYTMYNIYIYIHILYTCHTCCSNPMFSSRPRPSPFASARSGSKLTRLTRLTLKLLPEIWPCTMDFNGWMDGWMDDNYIHVCISTKYIYIYVHT